MISVEKEVVTLFLPYILIPFLPQYNPCMNTAAKYNDVIGFEEEVLTLFPVYIVIPILSQDNLRMILILSVPTISL